MDKSLKSYAKEAKKRFKNSFWQDYKSKVDSEVSVALADGVDVSKVVKYYQNKASVTIKGVKPNDEEFYLKVKKLLSEFGEVSDAIGMTPAGYSALGSSENSGRKPWPSGADFTSSCRKPT